MGFFKGQHDDSPVAIRITPTILPSESGDKSESPKTFTQTLTGCSVEASLSPGGLPRSEFIGEVEESCTSWAFWVSVYR